MRKALVRIGLCAAGAIYAAMGVVSVRVAFLGTRRTEQGIPGALRFLLERPFGAWLLGAVVAGLAGIAVARAVESAARRTGVLDRLGLAVSALGYAALAWTAARLLLHIRRGSPATEGVAWLLGTSWGAAAVEVAGAVVAIGGLVEVYRGLRGQLSFRHSLLRLPRTLAGIARFGLVARGLVLCTLGWFLIQAAEGLEPGGSHTMGGALAAFSGTALGPALLGAVGLGLGAYGIYLWTLALWIRRV